MTTSPTTTRFDITCYIESTTSPTGLDYELPVLSCTASEDMDRDNFGEVTLVMDWLDEATVTALDPRNVNMNLPGQVRFWVKQYALDSDSPIAYFPYADVTPAADAPAYLRPRDLQRDYIARTVTLTLSTGELFLDEKLRLASGNQGTGATRVWDLLEYAVDVAFPASTVIPTVDSLNEPLPAGPRRDFNSGNSALDLIRPELDALDERLFDVWGRVWLAQKRDYASSDLVSLATAPDLQSDADPIVFEMQERRSRDGEWADGVGIRYTPSGTAQWSGTGSSTKGVVLERDRPEPVKNAAVYVRNRKMKRGRDLDITALARLDVRSRRKIIVWTPDTYAEGTIRSIEFAFPEGTMRLRLQS